MKRPIFHVFRFVVLLFVVATWQVIETGRATAQVPVVQAVFPSGSGEIAIKQWRFFGPFRFEQKDIESPDAEKLPVGLNRDYLADFDMNEATLDAETLASVKTAKSGIVLDRQFRNDLVAVTPKTNILDLAIGDSSLNYAIAYLGVVIESPQDQDIVIAGGADDNMKLWLNHELVMADPQVVHRFIKKFRTLTGARLNKGRNFLLVKVGNLTGDWRAMVTLFPQDRALQLAEENAINPVLSKSVVPAGQPLSLRGDLLPSAQNLRVEIADFRHEIVDSAEVSAKSQMSRDLAKLGKDRLYFCRITASGRVIEKPFYYGDPDVGFAGLLERMSHLKGGPESVQIDLSAQLGRLKHLLKPENRSSDYWDQKVAASFAELENNLAALSESTEAFLHAPGTHLRGYRSSVDDQVLPYWVHVPESAQRSGRPIPLVIVLPWTALTNLPFLESYQMAAFEETERYRILGEEYGFAVLQVWGRGSYLGGTAIWKADVLEALDAVQKDYKIDPDRIYLVGDCEGGRQALLLAERHPDRFAAVAVEGPITITRNYPPVFTHWTQYVSPIAGTSKLVDIPILINHDGNDNSPPFQDSEKFASEAQRVGVKVALVQREGGFHGFAQNPTDVKRSLFDFFKDKQRKSQQSTENSPITRQSGAPGPSDEA